MKVPYFIKIDIEDKKEGYKDRILETKNNIDDLERKLTYEKSCLKAHEEALKELKEFEGELNKW